MIAAGFTEALGIQLTAGDLDAAETAEADRLVRDRYTDPEWLHPSAAAPDGTGTARFRSPDGPVRVFVAAHGSLIKSVLFTGDFTVPPSALTRLESSLRWQRLDQAAVERAVRESAGGPDADGWHSPEEVVTAVLTAGSRALQHANAHPHRATGSCYFPDSPSTTRPRDAE
jgi:hypothetical protein